MLADRLMGRSRSGARRQPLASGPCWGQCLELVFTLSRAQELLLMLGKQHGTAKGYLLRGRDATNITAHIFDRSEKPFLFHIMAVSGKDIFEFSCQRGPSKNKRPYKPSTCTRLCCATNAGNRIEFSSNSYMSYHEYELL